MAFQMSKDSPENNPKSPVNVVGAGITGLSAALLLARLGHKVSVYESESEAGGMLAPVTIDGIAFDRGSHRVHPEAHPLLVKLTQEAQWQRQVRAGTLVLKGRKLSYPLDPVRFIAGLGVKTTTSMALGWLKRPNALRQTMSWESDRREVQEDEGFQSFVVKRVGEAAYEQFYEPYARKVWGIEPDDLSQTVAKQRVSTSNPMSSILKKTEKHFLYPRYGMASLITLLRNKLEAVGGEVKFETPFSAKQSEFGTTFFTGHLGSLAPEAKLSHRGLYLLYLSVPPDALDNTDTWYVPESQYWFGRVSQPGRFSSELQAQSHKVLCIEIPEGKWGPDQDFVKQVDVVRDQLYAAGILNARVSPIEAHQKFLPKVYPMYVRNWVKEQRQALEQAAEQANIYPCGRQGLFLHCNMDQAVETAAAAVDHWSTGGDSLSWTKRCRDFADFRVRD